MSFKVNWPIFSEEFLEKAREQMTTALNKGNKPANIVDHIICQELYMGSKVCVPLALLGIVHNLLRNPHTPITMLTGP
jgi:hypothetical protein